jgi:hypothetical protein
MKKLYAIVGMAATLLAPSLYATFDGTITLSQGPYSYGNGGEFTAALTTSLPNILGAPTFQTFCIEYNEEFGPGNIYSFNENTGAVAGGAGAHATDPRTGLSMDNISIGTAWLYSQFRANTLANYLTGNRQQNAGNLQDAIWYLEGETTTLAFNGADGTYCYGLAKQYAGAGSLSDAQVAADSGGAYGVIALNLFDGAYSTPVTVNGKTYNLNQDQLAIDPSFVPEPSTIMAGFLMLLPFGASTLRILRRNRAV